MKILNTCNSNRDPGQLSWYHKVFKVKFILLKNQIATHCAIIMQLSSYNVGLDCTNRELPGNSSAQDTRGIRRSLSNGKGKCFKDVVYSGFQFSKSDCYKVKCHE